MIGKAIIIVKESLNSFVKDDVLTMSAALAYYSAFSVAPLLLIAVSLVGAFYGDEAVRGALDDELRDTVGSATAKVVQEMIAGARKPTNNILVSICGTLLLLVGAGGVFGQLQAALNHIWSVGAVPSRGIMGFIQGRFLSFSMVLVTGFLLLTSMLLTTVLQATGERLGELSGLPIGTWVAGSGILSFLIITGLFAAIFKVLPNAAIRWRDVWAGAVFTGALFMIGKLAIGWYLGRQVTNSAYGSAGSFVVLLMWLYYSSIILLFGAEFTKTQARLQGRDFKPL